MLDGSLYKMDVLVDDDKAELEAQMAEAASALKRAAIEKYGFAKVHQLRNEYKSQPKGTTNMLWFDPVARRMMDWMIANENRIIASYIGVTDKLCRTYAQHNSSPEEMYLDCLQEAATAIYDAMYIFHGGNAFSTFVHIVAKQRIQKLALRCEQMSKVSRTIKKLRTKVKKLVNERNCTLDEAIELLRETEGLSDTQVKKLRDANYDVERIAHDDVVIWQSEDETEVEEMWQAYRLAPLSSLERELIDAHLAENHGFRQQLAQSRMSPNTGRPYSRQRLSQLFLRACEKIRETHQELKNPEKLVA